MALAWPGPDRRTAAGRGSTGWKVPGRECNVPPMDRAWAGCSAASGSAGSLARVDASVTYRHQFILTAELRTASGGYPDTAGYAKIGEPQFHPMGAGGPSATFISDGLHRFSRAGTVITVSGRRISESSPSRRGQGVRGTREARDGGAERAAGSPSGRHTVSSGAGLPSGSTKGGGELRRAAATDTVGGAYRVRKAGT
jgi:hypothetical protein